MAQTPQQRRANQKFAKSQESQMGKPQIKKKQEVKAPISKGWIVLLAFVVFGGIIFELGAIFPKVWDWILGVFSSK